MQEDAKWFLEVRSFVATATATATATAPPGSLSTARPDPVLTPVELPFHVTQSVGTDVKFGFEFCDFTTHIWLLEFC